MERFGLDLSKHNGTLDFNEIKNAGNEFVILRAGYGTSTKDPKFEEYYAAAKAVGLKVGAYWYSYALNVSGALKEAAKFLEVAKGKQFEYPVFIDMEDADGYKKRNGMPSNATLSAICENFCDVVEKAGYYVGVYASESWFKNQLASINNDRFDRWLASWGNGDGTLQDSERKPQYKLHQYTDKYYLGSKRFDRNICYEFDYEKVIKEKGLNGFVKGSTTTTTPAPTPTANRLDTMTDEQVANEIIARKGDWGDGDVRRAKLGSRWESIQAIVNKKMGVTSTPKKELKVGSKVKIKKGAKDQNTKKTFASFVYSTTYTVIKISGNYVVFGKGKTATGKVTKSDVTLA